MKFTKEQIEKAAACKSVDELLALAKTEGIQMTREEAEKYFAQLGENKLSVDDIGNVAGGCLTNACGADASFAC